VGFVVTEDERDALSYTMEVLACVVERLGNNGGLKDKHSTTQMAFTLRDLCEKMTKAATK
jgi:hypothetical protein